MVTLNQAIAVAMVHGPERGLERLRALDNDERLANHYRLDAVRGHLFEMLGDLEKAIRALPNRGGPNDQRTGTKLSDDPSGLSRRGSQSESWLCWPGTAALRHGEGESCSVVSGGVERVRAWRKAGRSESPTIVQDVSSGEVVNFH